MGRRPTPQPPIELLGPSSFYIPDLLKEKGKTRKDIEFHRDKYAYVLHVITIGNSLCGYSESDYVPLHMPTLERLLGKTYAKNVLDEYLAWGILETDGYYKPGAKCTGYRVHRDYLSKPRWDLVFGDTLEKKLQKHRKQREDYFRRTPKKALSVGWANLHRLEIDELGAADLVDRKWDEGLACLDYYRESLGRVGSKGDFEQWKEEKEEEGKAKFDLMFPVILKIVAESKWVQWASLRDYLEDRIKLRCISYYYSIRAIATGDFYLEQPDAKSRIYHNITSLSTDLRQYLRLKDTNQPLVNLDLCNSQPYVFGLLLQAAYHGKSQPDDVKHYINLTAEGRFYEFLMTELNIPHTDRDRTAFKTTFFGELFFCSESYSQQTKPGKAFQRLFPHVLAVINQYKAKGRKKGQDKWGKDLEKKLLPVEMQRREAYIIQQRIGLTLAEEGIWFSTIHDSVVVALEHVERVSQLIREEFVQVMGIPPTLKADQWGRDM